MIWKGKKIRYMNLTSGDFPHYDSANGESNEVQEYLDFWEAYGKPLEDLGLKVVAYNPGVRIDVGYDIFDVPPVLMDLLEELVERRSKGEDHAIS